MLLNLRHIRAAHERFDKAYEPGAFPADHDTFRVVAPVALGFDVYRDKDQFRLAGRVQTALELPCSRCLEPFRWPIDAAFDLRYQPHALNTGEGNRRGRPLDRVLRARRDRSRPVDARAVSSGAADEATVPGRLPRALRDLRRGPESRPVRVQDGVGRSETGRAEDTEERRCLIQSDDIPRRGRPSAGRTMRSSRSVWPSARIATNPSSRIACAPTAATTADARCARSTKNNAWLHDPDCS
jgi:hypothetical protein